jgi:hypothetical protein
MFTTFQASPSRIATGGSLIVSIKLYFSLCVAFSNTPEPPPRAACNNSTAIEPIEEHPSDAKIKLLALVATAAAITHQTSSTPGELVAFTHGALYSPPLSTLEIAMKRGYLPSFVVGLSTITLKKYPPTLEAITMGHMYNRRKNIQSTKPKANLAQEQDHFPDQPTDNQRTNMCFLTAEPHHIVYSDQIGRLPQPSSSGINYLLIAYDYDSNAILMRPIKKRTAEALTAGIQDIHNTLAKGGCQPKFHRMDNECPQQVKDYLKKRDVQYQLAPPDDHTGAMQLKEPSEQPRTT